MTTQDLINQLKTSSLYAECLCGEEFKISDAILFDGTKPFPQEALEAKNNLIEELKRREEDLIKRKTLATTRAMNTAKAVNIGNSFEKVFPTLKDFKWKLTDSRSLEKPIDFVTFNGLSIQKITSLSFIEVKSGDAQLNKHQKAVRDAIEDKKVSYKEFK